jgi:nucleoside-diphosphate-sugar epimerase
MTKRVLITGIESFTGPYIAQALTLNGYEVYGLRQQKTHASQYATPLAGDLLDPDSLERVVNQCKPHIVIHLAAITYVPHADVAEMYQANVVGTVNLLSALAECNSAPERILLASSANVYGNAVDGLLDEKTVFSPENDYAVSKVAIEYMASVWATRLPISVVRPFNYTGVGQASKFLIPKIVAHFQEHKAEIQLGNTDVIRDFSDVRFVARAYEQLIGKAEPNEAYNICSGTGYSLESLIESMNEIAGYDIKVEVNPDFVRANEVKKLVGDNRKLLGLCPSLEVLPMQDTLKWMYSTSAKS